MAQIGKCPVELAPRPLNREILVLCTAICGLRVVKHCPDSILHCRTVTGVGSNGLATITSQQFNCPVCERPFPHILTHSPLPFTNFSFAFSLSAVPIVFLHMPPTFMLAYQVGRTIGQLITEKLECLGVTI